MRHSTLATLTFSLLSLALAQGCGGKVFDPNGTGAELEGPRADGGPVDTGIGSTPPGAPTTPPPSPTAPSYPGAADASPPAYEDASPPPEPTSVAEACDPGPGALTHPDQFVAFEWSREHPTCGGSSSCSVSFQLGPDCTGTGHYNGVPFSLRLPAAECLAFKRWATSDRLVGGLRDESICPGGDAKGNPEEMGTTLTSGTVNRKIDPVCNASPFLQNRQCIDAVLTGYVPGPTVWP